MKHITIEGTKYPYKFGASALRGYCEDHNLTMQQMFDQIADMAPENGEEVELSWGSLDFLAGITYQAITRVTPDGELTEQDVFDWMFSNPDELQVIMDEFGKSLPQPQKKSNRAQRRKTAKK